MDTESNHPIRPMNHIVCAVRGQPQSRATVARAMELTLEHGARLTFIHVMDAEFLAHATVGIPRLMYRELRAMGEFMMEILKEQAKQRGVHEVDAVLLEGRVEEEIPRFLEESGADLLILGAPARNALSPEAFSALVRRVAALGVRMELAA